MLLFNKPSVRLWTLGTKMKRTPLTKYDLPPFIYPNEPLKIMWSYATSPLWEGEEEIMFSGCFKWENQIKLKKNHLSLYKERCCCASARIFSCMDWEYVWTSLLSDFVTLSQHAEMFKQPTQYFAKASMTLLVSCLIDRYIKSYMTRIRLSFTKSGRYTFWLAGNFFSPREKNNVHNQFCF